MRLDMPDRFAPLEGQFLEVLRRGIFELDDLFQFGLVRFELGFGEADGRKLRRVTDRRRFLGDDPRGDDAGPAPEAEGP